MSSYYFSAQKKAFYLGSLQADYVAAGNWPSDIIEITDAEFKTYSAAPPAGMSRGVDVNGHPTFINTPQPVLTNAQIQAPLVAAVQRAMDLQAQALGYDSIFTAVTYADEPSVPSFQQQGQALRAWRSQVWEVCYDQLNKVLAGTAPVPTAAELVALMPPFAMPS